MLTDFGKMCRKIRIDADEILATMAERLGVAASFLSAVENGRKNVPVGWCDAITKEYNLSDADGQKLVIAAENSQKQVKIQLENLKSQDRDLVMSFARKFEQLNSKEKSEIYKILKND
ncbi:helix-turn-helix domain-containing protein [Aminipila sp.]|uniref:helix-turn-helix domain-containing protein n=1 Tax=Aminipila sp. TaxID=2060095 RepID=UPI00289D58FC|nr:transcriptional regulator [Aminipila sp.]